MGQVRLWLNVHRKLVVVVAGAGLTVAVQVWGTSNPWVALGVLTATSLGVYQVPNAPAPAEPAPAEPLRPVP